jgi:hypothetical protein
MKCRDVRGEAMDDRPVKCALALQAPSWQTWRTPDAALVQQGKLAAGEFRNPGMPRRTQLN